MTQIDQLKKAIQAAVPEILELNVNCRTDKGTVIAVFESEGREKYLTRVSAHWPESADGILYTKSQLGEILGRPITLADVLLAISKIAQIFIIVSENGRFYKKIAIQEYEELGDWDLSKDLDGQSDECKAFLAKILL